ncbi:MAG: hypothetical protein J1F23_03200 [Oscillospiraceae bacterium]|nr:hypothetical protein [Oscillospiraceae bacterium]
MKRACYILSMAGCLFSALSLILMEFFPEIRECSPFYLILLISSFLSPIFAIVLTIILAVLLPLFISLSHFRSEEYKYASLAIWLVLLFPDAVMLISGIGNGLIRLLLSIVFMDEGVIRLLLGVVFTVSSFFCAKENEL